MGKLSERMRIGALVKMVRLSMNDTGKRMSQKEFAEKIGTSKDRLSRIERGMTTFRADEMIVALKEVGITVTFSKDIYGD